MPPFWNQRTFCVVTGASRGIGKCIAVEFAKKVDRGSVFLLIARSAQALEETKSEILSAGVDISIVTAALDLGKPNAGDYLHAINSALSSTGTTASDFEHAILVHNAVSLGNVSLKVTELDNLQELREFYDCNLISMILLTSQFFKVFHDSLKQRSVVQMSAKAGATPMKNMSAYCAGRAARDMFIRSLVVEDSSISALSYFPGMVDTDMFKDVESNSPNAELGRRLQELRASGSVQTPLEAVTKLIRTLEEQKFVNGERVVSSNLL